MAQKATKPPPPPTSDTLSHGDYVEYTFDDATTRVYNMMVESYISQRGEEPSEETKVEWATNLVALSNQAAAKTGAKLKVRKNAI